MTLYLLTFGAGLLVGGAFVGTALWATYEPALHVARTRAESAELHARILSTDRKAN